MEALLASPLETRLGRWADLTEQKRAKESELRLIQDELTQMEPALIEDMALAGVQSMNVNGFQVYRQREFYARAKEGVDKETLIERFRAAGLSHCLGMQHQTLRALAKEWADDEGGPPSVVTELVDMGEVFRLRARKS